MKTLKGHAPPDYLQGDFSVVHRGAAVLPPEQPDTWGVGVVAAQPLHQAPQPAQQAPQPAHQPPLAFALPSLGKLDSAELPNVPAHYREAIIKTAGDDAEPREDNVFDASVELGELTQLAFGKLREILNLDLTPDDDNFAVAVRSSLTAATTILTTATRVDENRLRQRQLDKLPELLKIIMEEEHKLPATRLIEAVAG